MDESAVSFHTPETKRQSKQWVKKGPARPFEGKGSRFEGEANGACFLWREGHNLHEFRAEGQNGRRLLHLDCPDQIPESFQAGATCNGGAGLVAALGIRPGPHRRHCGGLLSSEGGEDSPPSALFAGLAQADFFLFPKVKAELAGQTLTQETFKNSWEGVIRSVAKEDFAAAFRSWKERWKKCISVSGNYDKK